MGLLTGRARVLIISLDVHDQIETLFNCCFGVLVPTGDESKFGLLQVEF